MDKAFEEVTQCITNAYLLLETHSREIIKSLVLATRDSKDDNFVKGMYGLLKQHRTLDSDCRVAIGRYQELISKIIEVEQDIDIALRRNKEKDLNRRVNS